MGPPQAKESLLETVYMGADNGVLLSDRVFAGADVQATSYALKTGVEKIGKYDLIICGKQTTDGDTQIELMRGIKKVFDPNNILNPGKLF